MFFKLISCLIAKSAFEGPDVVIWNCFSTLMFSGLFAVYRCGYYCCSCDATLAAENCINHRTPSVHLSVLTESVSQEKKAIKCSHMAQIVTCSAILKSNGQSLRSSCLTLTELRQSHMGVSTTKDEGTRPPRFWGRERQYRLQMSPISFANHQSIQ